MNKAFAVTCLHIEMQVCADQAGVVANIQAMEERTPIPNSIQALHMQGAAMHWCEFGFDQIFKVGGGSRQLLAFRIDRITEKR